ncbi:hypothetical protein CAEBREN_21238 [Caenorhabditis brenneri]|uniref:Uncharacterized protein n=1 Tax=Caenorhabditis brenneri TaxID=135651 RepID=G0NIV6_CAEBE|nr:hypothetical protein CAEBREN_21238 [Caenorhabditis brenneri]
MSKRSKYGYNGVAEFKNFERRLAAGEFPTELISLIRAHGWFVLVPLQHYLCVFLLRYITLKVREQLNQVYPYISCRTKPEHKVRAFFKIKAKSSTLSHETERNTYLEWDEGVSGPSISIQKILNPKNGYLKNGVLSVEYGFQIDAFKDDGIWNFDFLKKMFDSKGGHNTVTCYHYRSNSRLIFHCPEQLLKFHSLSEEADIFVPFPDVFVEDCLQIAHGVRIRISASRCLVYAEIGREMGMMNVVHYCDRMYVQNYPDKRDLKKAIKLNMRQSVPQIMGL